METRAYGTPPSCVNETAPAGVITARARRVYMPANPEPLFEATDNRHYYYRRRLGMRELVPAVAVGVGAGLVAFYLARLFAQRTPLLDDSAKRRPRRAGGKG